jgi:tripartite-type tricarboxylate transporter receptor subunit TctC
MKHLLNVILLAFLPLFVFAGQPVSLIIQTGPGGLNHKYALEFAPVLGKILDAPIVVEFKPGGNGIVGARALQESKQLTLMLGAAQPEFEIDQIAGIIPLLELGTAPVMILSNPTSNIKILKDLTKQGKSITLGYANGSAQIFWVREFIKNNKNINIIEVPYKTGTAALTDLVGGHIDLAVVSALAATPLVIEGKAVAITNLSTTRSLNLPDVLTPREQGFKFKHDTLGFANLFVWTNPAIDKETLTIIRKEFNAWLQTPEAKDLYKNTDLAAPLYPVAPEVGIKQHLKQ